MRVLPFERQLLLGHYDLGWHLAAGDLIRDRGDIPFQDPWAFTLGDKQWHNLSWLWDVIASVLFQYTKFGGLTLFVVACGAVIVWYLASVCLSSGASAAAVCIAVFFGCLLYPAFGSAPNIYLAASPNMATVLFCVIFYAECLKRTRCFLLPPIMVLWVNLHGGFLLGFLIVGIFCAVALLRRDWKNLGILCFAGLGCFLAIFVNPLGWHIYDGVAATLGHFVQANIGEWDPITGTCRCRRAFPASCIFRSLSCLNCTTEIPAHSPGVAAAFLAVPVAGILPGSLHVFLFSVLDCPAGAAH